MSIMPPIPVEIVNDLLPLYYSGEASAPTRALVESYFEANPEYAAKMKMASQLPLDTAASASLPPDLQRLALNRTKQLIGRRTLYKALAITFTLIPLSFAFEEGRGVSFFLFRDAQPVGWIFWALAAICWLLYWSSARRLRLSGV